MTEKVKKSVNVNSAELEGQTTEAQKIEATVNLNPAELEDQTSEAPVNLNPADFAGQATEAPANLNPADFAGQATDLAYKVLYPVYQEKREEYDVKLVNSDWKVLCSPADMGASKYSYKAVAFMNNKSKEIHIASAGTKADVNDLWDDTKLVVDGLPSKLESAQVFLSKIVDLLGESTEAKAYTFSTSGHSLGAIVADLTGAEMLSRGLNFKSSITFENPGSANVIKEAVKAGLFTGKAPWEYEQLSASCTVYNAVPNFINTCKSTLAHNINLVLPPKLTTEQPVDMAQSWAGYLYNKVGNAATTCLDYLGIKKFADAVSQHKLGNFLQLEQAITLPVNILSWRNHELNQLALELPDHHPIWEKLAQKKSTGKDVVILKKIESIEEGYSLMETKIGEYAFEDLRDAYVALEPEQPIEQPILTLGHMELLDDIFEEELGDSDDEGYGSDTAMHKENIVESMAACDDAPSEQNFLPNRFRNIEDIVPTPYVPYLK